MLERFIPDEAVAAGTEQLVSLFPRTSWPIERTYLGLTDYPHRNEAEMRAEEPAGSGLAYRPDVFHRGVRRTDPDGASRRGIPDSCHR